MDVTGKAVPAVTINIGNFLQSLVDFSIVAFAVFLIIKAINGLHRAAEVPAAPPEPTQEELLLTEIRDLLKKSDKVGHSRRRLS